MNRIKNTVLYILLLGFAAVFLFYLAFLFLFPNILNSEVNILKIEDFIHKKTGLKIVTENFVFNSSPNLNLKISAGKIEISNAVMIKNLNGCLGLKSVKKLTADDIIINQNELSKYLSQKDKTNKKSSFDFKKLPQIYVKNLEYRNDDIFVKVRDITYNGHIIKFAAEIDTPALQNTIFLGNDGMMIVKDNKLLAKNFGILIGKAAVSIDGILYDDKNKFDFAVKGNNLPVNDIEKYLLYYQKSQDPAKKFIENFKDYSGKIDVDLSIKKQGIFGTAAAKELRANTVLFTIPIYFKDFVMNFKGKDISSTAVGLLGGEKVIHILKINKLGSPDKEVTGIVTSSLTDKFRYIPDLKILKSADAKVIYNIKNKIINVEYFLTLAPGADLLYKQAFLGLRDKSRRFYFHTLKNGSNMYIKRYDYSLSGSGKSENIILGDGLLVKQNGKMKLKYLTCKTNGYAPASVTGSFGEYIKGGEFSGDLKYNFDKNQILGNFEIINTQFKKFFVKSAKIIADDNNVKIAAGGTYEKEEFDCNINAQNNFKDNITVHNMDMFLNRIILTGNPSEPPHKKKKGGEFSKIMHECRCKKCMPYDTMPEYTRNSEISSKIKDADITIENWNIKLNEIKKDKIAVKNIKLSGSLQNNIFTFSMPDLDFAGGTLNAKGEYNFEDESASIDFNAGNINSNIVADMFFNLAGQIEGIADASLKVRTLNNLKDIKGKAQFSIKNGFLPKIGSTEFMVKNSKYKVTDFINFDFSQKEALQSNINGKFTLDNSRIKDIVLTSQQKYFSFFLEGNYEILEQNADLSLYGKYNKEAPKGIKILFVPLDWILKVVFRPENSMDIYRKKLAKIPSIDALQGNEKFFRVKMEGNLNKDKVRVEIKGIK